MLALVNTPSAPIPVELIEVPEPVPGPGGGREHPDLGLRGGGSHAA